MRPFHASTREHTGLTEQTIQVIPYSKPKIRNAEAVRCTKDGTPSDSGTYLKLTAARTYSPALCDGQQHNFCQIRYCYKPEAAAEFSPWETILEENAEGDSVITEPLLEGHLDATKTYVVRIGVKDTFSPEPSYTTLIIPSEKVYMHRPAGGRAMGLGGYAEEDDLLDVHWNVRIRKGLVIGDEQVDDYVVEEGADGDWSYRKWHSGIAECWCVKAYAGETDTTWGSLYGLVCTPPDYPAIFTEAPVTVRDVAQNTGSSCWLSGWSAASITNPGIFALLRPTSASLDVTVNFFAIGKWK